MADRITEDEISVLLKHTRRAERSEEQITTAYKPEPGETVTDLVRRLLTINIPFRDGEFDRLPDRVVELRVIERPSPPTDPNKW